jgi:hypothetical protein
MKYLGILFAFFLPFTVGAQCLNGNYTIGGTSPNYSTLTAAVNALVANGVCGPVVFDIRNGTYNEQISIPAIAGSSGVNTITFRSESSDSSLVDITFSSSSVANNYTVRFNGCDYVRLEEVTVSATDFTYGCAVDVRNASLSISVLNCRITSNAANTGSSVVYSADNSIDHNFKIENCAINGASYGIGLNNGFTTSGLESGIVIRNNRITGFTTRGIWTTQVADIIIEDNIIQATVTANVGLFFSSGTTLQTTGRVCRNKIYGLLYTGLAIEASGSSGNRFPIYNNSISVGNVTSPVAQYCGILHNSGMYVDLVNNSVNVYGTSSVPNNDAAYSTSMTLDEMRFYNNIFCNTGNGHAFKSGSGTLCYNTIIDYNNYYTNGTRFLSSNGITYTTIAAWTAAFSLDANSVSFIPYFYATNDLHSHQTFLKARGIAHPTVVTDMDLQVRNNPPDIGADEITPLANDAASLRGNYPSVLCAGVIQVNTYLYNNGSNNLTSAQLGWSVNAVVQTPFNWTGNLLPGDSVLVIIGNYTINSVNTYTIQTWSNQPNNSTDPFTLNDIITYTLGSALSGNYTVGGSAPDFVNVVSAATAVSTRGVCGPVTFLIRNGTYSGQVNIGTITGASTTNRVRFISQSGDSSQVVISASGNSTDNYVIHLAGTSYITFSEVSITNTNSTYGSVMRFSGSFIGDSINHCVISAPAAATNADLIYETGNGSKSEMAITGNRFVNGANAINWSISSSDSDFRIENNIVQCLQSTGEIYLYQVTGLIISHNDVVQGTVHVRNIYSYLHITGNDIRGLLRMEWCQNLPDILIVNNAVTNSSGTLTVSNCSGLRLINNTFRNTGNTTSISFQNSYYNTYFNNIASTVSSLGTVLSANSALTFDTCDYNGWYTTGVIFCSFNSTNYSTFSAWQAATTYDSNSVHQDPLYLSPTDYHLQNASPMLQLALSVAEAPDDIDGDVRGPMPDFGADENYFYTVEASLTGSNFSSCLNAATPLTIDILNNGGLNLTSCTINWSVNQVMQSPVSWTGNILPTQTLQNVPVSVYPFVLGNTYTVKIWVSNPNNSTDPLPYNDTVSGVVIPRYSGVFTVGGSAPDFVNPQAAIDSLELYGVCGPVILNIRNGTYDGVDIAPIPGSSAANTITLTSASGDSSMVIFQTVPDSLSSAAGATFLLDSASNIHFHKLTFCSGVSIVPQLIQLVNHNNNITISNCAFRGIHGTIPPTVSEGLISSQSGTYSNVRIINNLFVDGAGGVTLDVVNGLFIIGNQFYYQEKTGISAGASDSLAIRYNNITDAGLYANYTGIYCAFGSGPSASDTALIAENVIEIQNGLTGIEYSSGTASPSFTTLIRNNALSVNGSAGTNGIIINGYGVRVIFNTVRMQGATCNAAISTVMTDGFIYNNCFANYCPNGRAFHYVMNSSVQQNNNNYYSAAGTLGSVGPANYATLISYQSATASESNSNSGNPLLFNTPFWKPGSSALQNAGSSMNTYAPKDIEGQLRFGTPDIGVDEYAPLQDLSLYGINSAALTCSGTHTVQVAVRNTGSYTASAFLIHWEVNGVPQPTFNWGGSLPAGDSLTSLTIGTFTSFNGSADVLVHIQYPGDFYHANDTVRNNRALGPLSGDYTVGGPDPDFRMLDDAFTAIEMNGVCGAVRLTMRDGFYYEHAALSDPGLSFVNNLTIESESRDSSAVTLFQFMADPLLVPTLLSLDTVTDVTIRKIGFNNGTLNPYPSSNAIAGITIYNCANIRVTHAMFTAASWSNASLNCVRATNIEVDSCNLLQANNAVCLGSLFQLPDTVRSITFYDNQLAGNLNVYRAADVMVYDNIIYGMDIQKTGDSVAVFRNIVHDHTSLRDVYGTINGRCALWNNFFANGLSASNIQFTDVQYNNIGFYQAVPNISEAFTLTQANNCSVVNNNIACTYYPANGVADINIPAITNCTIDYNNYWNGSQSVLIAAHQAGGFDSSSLSINPQFISNIDLHIQNILLAGTAIPIAGIQHDIDGDLRSLTNPGIGADDAGAVTVYSSLVWPGNANKDTIVDNYDLLPIGLYIGQSGYNRQSFSNAWVGYPCYDWNSIQANGYNMKFADSNGDGVVTTTDTLAISLNYGQLDFSPPVAPPFNAVSAQSVGPPLHFVTSATTYLAGSAVDVYVWAGDAAQPVAGLYGAAFTINYTPAGIASNTTDLYFLNSWLCNPLTDGFTIDRSFESQSIAEGTAVRYDHAGRNGYGPLAVFHFVSDSSITQPTTIYFDFSRYEMVDSAGNIIPCTSTSDSVIITPVITTVNTSDTEQAISVYPNPATETAQLAFSAVPGNNTILIADVLGQIVYQSTLDSPGGGDVLLQVDLTTFSNGVYLVTIGQNGVSSSCRFTVTH